MKRYVYDTEADNLLENWRSGEYETVDRMWCGVVKDVDSGKIWKYDNGEWGWRKGDKGPIDFFAKLEEANILVAHNQLGFDLPMLRLLFGFHLTKRVKIVDTYVLSRLLNPDRPSHSLEYWGKVLKRGKVEHEDWGRFSEEMMHRCTEDVELNEMVYRVLLREMR